MSELIGSDELSSSLEGWREKAGSDILVHIYDKVEIDITSIPHKQTWTDSNLPKAKELENISKIYQMRNILNHTLLTFQSMTLDDEDRKIGLMLGTCSYYEHLAYITGDVEGLKSPEAILVSLLVETNDGNLIFAERNRVSIGENKIGIIGGTYDYSGNSQKVPNPEDIAREELQEELGIDINIAKDPGVLDFVSFINDRWGRPVLFYKAKLPLNKREISNSFEESEEAKTEHRRLIFVENNLDSLKAFARQHPSFEFHPPADALFLIALRDKLTS